jgi:hypothetical protein
MLFYLGVTLDYTVQGLGDFYVIVRVSARFMCWHQQCVGREVAFQPYEVSANEQ